MPAPVPTARDTQEPIRGRRTVNRQIKSKMVLSSRKGTHWVLGIDDSWLRLGGQGKKVTGDGEELSRKGNRGREGPEAGKHRFLTGTPTPEAQISTRGRCPADASKCMKGCLALLPHCKQLPPLPPRPPQQPPTQGSSLDRKERGHGIACDTILVISF